MYVYHTIVKYSGSVTCVHNRGTSATQRSGLEGLHSTYLHIEDTTEKKHSQESGTSLNTFTAATQLSTNLLSEDTTEKKHRRNIKAHRHTSIIATNSLYIKI
jgi:hypothetical protein